MRKYLLYILLALGCLNHFFAQLRVVKANFAHPADQYKSGVYWCFMDGNMSAQTITKDLEAMIANLPLSPSGLIGPVTIKEIKEYPANKQALQKIE